MFEKWKARRTPAPAGPPEYLIAGLGNPGPKYEYTRHNAGFLCVDLLAQQLGVKIDRIKFKSVTAAAQVEGHSCLLMKPQTFMNNSGEAIRDAAHFYKIPPERIIYCLTISPCRPVGCVSAARARTAGTTASKAFYTT